MNKRITLGLLLTVTLLVAGASTVTALPTRTTACDGCHAYPPQLINITTDKTSITAAPGEAFTVNVAWKGGANDGATSTAVKWPSVLNNDLFIPNPVMPVSGVNPSGTASSTLTAPATAGSYTVRVYAATGTWSGIPTKETDYKDIAITVAAPLPSAPGTPAIISFSPPSPVMDNVGASRTFSVTVNQTVDITWYLNGTKVQLDAGVTGASYTNTSAASGTWNVSAVAANANGTAVQKWDWVVKATSPPPSNLVANVTFVVIDSETGLPIDDAKVSLNGIKIKTDSAGTAIFANIALGDYTYRVSKEEYAKVTGNISVAGDTTVTVKLASVVEENEHTEKEHAKEEQSKEEHTEEKQDEE